MATPRQAGRVAVQVVAVAAGHNFMKDMLVPVGQTVGWSVNASGLYGLKPELRCAKLGVWGKVAKPETVVAEGDRIEVYVPCTTEAVQKARQLNRELRARGIAVGTDLGDNAE